MSAVELVDLAGLERAEPPAHLIYPILPSGEVTLLSGHGGTGKSWLTLQLALSVAAGRKFLAWAAQSPQPTLIYSAEDAAGTLRWRIRCIARDMGIDVDQLARDELLTLVDATEKNPILHDGVESADNLESLRVIAKERGAKLVIIDNSSEVYDGEEKDRARVRAAMRAFRGLARDLDAAVLLLGHVNRLSASGSGGSENYSGSTAWHNSARSRLFLSRTNDGVVLRQEKATHAATPAPDVRLSQRKDGAFRLLPAQLERPLARKGAGQEVDDETW